MIKLKKLTEMKKMNYAAPEQEVIELKYQESLLAGSAGSETSGGTEDSEQFAPEMDFDFKEEN